MIWLLIPAFVLVVWMITVEVRLSDHRSDLAALPTPTKATKYTWTITEWEGEWRWTVRRPRFDPWRIELDPDEVEFQGATDSRIKAQKAVERALWKLHKRAVLPTIHVGGRGGEWSA